MKIKIGDVAFEGYPENACVHFDAGAEVDVPDDFGAMVVGKGLAHAADVAAPATEEQVSHAVE